MNTVKFDRNEKYLLKSLHTVWVKHIFGVRSGNVFSFFGSICQRSVQHIDTTREDSANSFLIRDGEMSGTALNTHMRLDLASSLAVFNNRGFGTERCIIKGQFENVLPQSLASRDVLAIINVSLRPPMIFLSQ